MVGTHDPYPNGIPGGKVFKVTKPKSEVIPLIWNMKNWDVTLDASLDVEITSEDEDGDTQDVGLDFSLSVSGQFSDVDYTFDYEYQGDYTSFSGENILDTFVYDGEPKYRICGNGRFFNEAEYNPGIETGGRRESLILPKVWVFASLDAFDEGVGDSISWNRTIPDEEGDQVGLVSFSRYFLNNTFNPTALWDARVEPNFIRLKDDGDADIYFAATLMVDQLGTEAGMSYRLRNEQSDNTYNDDGYYPVSFNFLGETVDGKLWYYQYRETNSDGNPYNVGIPNFNFNYDITVNEFYTY